MNAKTTTPSWPGARPPREALEPLATTGLDPNHPDIAQEGHPRPVQDRSIRNCRVRTRIGLSFGLLCDGLGQKSQHLEPWAKNTIEQEGREDPVPRPPIFRFKNRRVRRGSTGWVRLDEASVRQRQ